MTMDLADLFKNLSMGAILVICFGGGILLAVILADFGGDSAKKRLLCDHAVDLLLHSDNLVEVTRAGIIIREVDCSIGRRL